MFIPEPPAEENTVNYSSSLAVPSLSGAYILQELYGQSRSANHWLSSLVQGCFIGTVNWLYGKIFLQRLEAKIPKSDEHRSLEKRNNMIKNNLQLITLDKIYWLNMITDLFISY